MRAKEARAMIGSPVIATTLDWGEYVGTLTEVFGSPWRAKVQITGVLRHAAIPADGRGARRGYRVGESVEVGGVCCKRAPDGVVGGTYLDALRGRWMELQRDFATFVGEPVDSARLIEMNTLARLTLDEERRIEHAVARIP